MLVTKEMCIKKPKRVFIENYITIEELVSRWNICPEVGTGEEKLRNKVHRLQIRAYEEIDFYEDIHDGSARCTAREYWRYCYWPRDFEFEDATKESLINNNRFVSPDTCVTISAYFDVEKCMPSEEEIVFDLNDIIQIENDNPLITCRRLPVKSRSDLRREGQYYVPGDEDQLQSLNDECENENISGVVVKSSAFKGCSPEKAVSILRDEGFSDAVIAYVLRNKFKGSGDGRKIANKKIGEIVLGGGLSEKRYEARVRELLADAKALGVVIIED